jgi:CubicO group peptidase (beta-lactamase class C family)
MFSLGVAMDNFLKSVEDEDANIWAMIAEEVFEPIGIHHTPINLTFEEDGKMGQPKTAFGRYPALNDLAKFNALLHARGSHGGQQILHEDKTRSLFLINEAFEQGPATELEYGFCFTRWDIITFRSKPLRQPKPHGFPLCQTGSATVLSLHRTR